MATVEKKRIINLAEKSAPENGDFFAVDSQAGGTKKIPATAIAKAVDLTAEAAARTQADNALTSAINSASALIQNPTKTLSGALCSFTDGADMPMVACTASIVPKQSGTGTPSPDNVRQISGWESVSVFDTGVNVWDEEWELGSYNSETGAKVNNTTRIRTTNKIPCKGGTTYYFKVGVDSTYGTMCYYDASETFISSYSFTGNATFAPPSNACYCAWTILNYGTTYNHDISINYPSTDTNYHAYNGTTTPVNLGRTVYGGTLDVVSGELTVDRAMVIYNGSENWGVETGPQYTGSSFYIAKPSGTGDKYDVFQSNITNKFTLSMSTAQDGVCITARYFNCILGNILGINNVADFKTWLSSHNLQIVYPLATPQTYQLTPTEIQTLLGENNVWADSGDVEITYRRDISIVLENLENALNGSNSLNTMMMSAPTENTAEEPTEDEAENDMR